MLEGKVILVNDKKYIFIRQVQVNNRIINHYLDVGLFDYLTEEKYDYDCKENEVPNFHLFSKETEKGEDFITSKKEILKILQELDLIPNYILENPLTDLPIELAVQIPILVAGLPMVWGKRAWDIIKEKPKALSEEERDKFISEQKENLIEMQKSLDVDIDLEKSMAKLDELQVYKTETMHTKHIGGYYNSANNKIKILEKYFNDKSIRLHETIHYLAGKEYAKKNSLAKFLVEGMTENLTSTMMKNDFMNNSVVFKNEAKKDNMVYAMSEFNFETRSYMPYVAIVKQIEHMTGMKSYSSAINGDQKFCKETLKAIGAINFADLCINDRSYMSIARDVVDLERIQNNMMKYNYNKKFKEIQSLDDAKVFLEDLRELEKYRVRNSFIDKNGNISRNEAFKKFYLEKVEKLEKRYPNELYDYKYKEQEFDCIKKKNLDINNKKDLEFINEKVCNGIGVMNTDFSKIDTSEKENIAVSGGRIFALNKFIPIDGKSFPTDDVEFLRLKVLYPDLDDFTVVKMYAARVGAQIIQFDIKEHEEKISEVIKMKNEEVEQLRAEAMNKLKKQTLFDKMKIAMVKKIINKKQQKNKKLESNTIEIVEKKVNNENKDELKKSWDLSNWGTDKEKIQQKSKIAMVNQMTTQVERKNSVEGRDDK